MNILDVNVLVALYCTDHPNYESARAWWDATARRGESLAVPDVVAVGFARIATDPRILVPPASLAEAWAFIDAISAQPHCLKYVAGPDTMANCVKAATAANARGPLLTDAYIATCAMDYGATVVTFDRDFRKFDNLRVLELA